MAHGRGVRGHRADLDPVQRVARLLTTGASWRLRPSLLSLRWDTRSESRRERICTYDPRMDPCSYATLHLARFDDLKTMGNIDVKPTSGEPVAWIVGGDEIAAGTKAGSQEAFSWVALGLHSVEGSARVLVEAGVAAVPCLEDASEVWSAVLQPFSHRGDVNWLDHESPGQAFSIDGQGRNSDPFVVVTSVGWTIDDRFDPSRAADFAAGSEKVRQSMSSTDGLHSRQIFNFPRFADDTVTVTFWREMMPPCAHSPIEPASTRCRWTATGSWARLIERHLLDSGCSNRTATGMDRTHWPGDAAGCSGSWAARQGAVMSGSAAIGT